MVQYVITPWRDRAELLRVKAQFAPTPKVDRDGLGTDSVHATVKLNDEEQTRKRKAQHKAVARVSMWMQRGNCPHMVESTALLMAAVLCDEEASEENTAASAYALRASYASAFSRFVTGLLDGHQDKQRKQSMYAIAKTIGLPATFVELRHQSTHEQLPSLAKLRDAAHKALDYIWNYYWKNLEELPSTKTDDRASAVEDDPCPAVVLRYLREYDPAKQNLLIEEMRQQWPTATLLEAIKGLRGRLPGNQAYLKGMQLAKVLKDKQEQADLESVGRPSSVAGPPSTEAVVASDGQASSEMDAFWHLYEGPMEAKPMGAYICPPSSSR